jgi:hypothetical protein
MALLVNRPSASAIFQVRLLGLLINLIFLCFHSGQLVGSA